MKHDIQPSAPVIAYGEGLTSAVEGKPATFVVDSKGQRGELTVQVDGNAELLQIGIQRNRLVAKYLIKKIHTCTRTHTHTHHTHAPTLMRSYTCFSLILVYTNSLIEI